MNASPSIRMNNWIGFLNQGLAERELQCVMAIAAGASSKEVARELGISKDGVDKRLAAAGLKLGVIRRAALVAEAFRRGLISPMIIILCAILVGQSAVNDNSFNRIRRPGERRIENRAAVRRVEAFQAA